MKNKILSGKSTPENIYTEIIASLLLIFFVHTLVSSFIQLQSVKNMLAFYTRNNTLLAWLIIIAEAIVAVLIFFPRTRLTGFTAAWVVISFAGAAILLYPHYPHDFGGLFNTITRKQKWILIASVIILSTAGITIKVLKQRQLRRDTDSTHHIVYT